MKDFSLVHRWLLDITDWFTLGATLGLSYPTLEAIRIEHREQVSSCRCAMIYAWMCEKDCVKEHGGCTRQALISALKKINENSIASTTVAEGKQTLESENTE